MVIYGSPWFRRAAQAIVITCLLCHPLAAQDEGNTPLEPDSQYPSAASQPLPASLRSPIKSPKESTTQSKLASAPQFPKNDRIFYTLPNYNTVDYGPLLPPLTPGQKFKLTAVSAFDPMQFVFVGIQAGIGQGLNSNPTFGQGLKGYGKRYALTITDGTIENFMAHAVFPSALRQDPRYYRLGYGGFIRRSEHIMKQVAVTRSDTGTSQFNYSEILGAATAAGISNAYHPRPRTLRSNLDEWGTQIGGDVAAYTLKEFWPDIHRFLKHGRNPA